MKDANTARNMQRIMLLILLVLVIFTISASVVEASAMGSIKSFWSKASKFVKSPAFWVNSLILFAGLFIVQILLLKDKIGSDTTQKVILYFVLIVIALIIATKIIASNGIPQYIWKQGEVGKVTQFLIGPPNPISSGDCNGSGAYLKILNGKTVCRQAIFRTNDNGSGLPALIVAFLLLYILFNAYKSNLGMDKMGDKGGKWTLIILAGLLAILIANQGTPKNTLIIIGGWIAVILLGGTLSKTLSGDNGPKNTKKGFGFGLAFAFIQLMANILGTSLFGGDYNASDINTGTIIINILIGLVIGYLYSTMSGEGIFGKWRKRVEDKQKKNIDQLCDESRYGAAFTRQFPFTGYSKKLRPTETTKEVTQRDKILRRQLARLNDMYNRIASNPHSTPVQLDRIMTEIITTTAALTKEEMSEIDDIREENPGQLPRDDDQSNRGLAPQAPDV